MATMNATESFENSIEIEINQIIDGLIYNLNERRMYLLTVVKEKQDEITAILIEWGMVKKQLRKTRIFLENEITHNVLNSVQGRIMLEIENKLSDLPPLKEIRFKCDTSCIEEQIKCLGEIVLNEVPSLTEVPDYGTFQRPAVVVGKEGDQNIKFSSPRGVAISEETGNIYVADRDNKRIQIFAENGDYRNEFGNDFLEEPWGTLIHQNYIYVTDCVQQAVLKFNLEGLSLEKKVGEEGSGSDQFNHPLQLAISPDEQIHIADQWNHRIQVLNKSLEFISHFEHESMTRPVDVKFSNEEIFVLSYQDNPCMHIFNLSGEKSRSLITSGDGMSLKGAYFFCLDGKGNIVISDWLAHSIKVYSNVGDLQHTIGGEGEGEGRMFTYPNGIAIMKNTKLICVSQNDKFALQIFA